MRAKDKPIPANTLCFGDNLQVLREHIADESVDLIYLDPPFNSKRDYNLSRSPSTATRRRRSPPSKTLGTGASTPKTSGRHAA
jgi:DNA modification methylase